MYTEKRTKIAWFDTETTGVDHSKHDIWQIAMLIEADGAIIDELEIKMRPRRMENFIEEPFFLEKGITRDFLSSLPDPDSQLNKFKRFLAKHVNKFDKEDKLVPAGYNIPCDLDFLRGNFTASGDKYFGSWFFNTHLEVRSFVSLATIHGFRPSNFKLGTVCELLGVPIDAHDALSDIRATRQLYTILKGYAAL